MKELGVILMVASLSIGLLVYSWALTDREPYITSRCRNGLVEYKWRGQDYWTIGGDSEGKPRTECRND